MILDEPTLLVVHCVDAEGPLDETLVATFARMKALFGVDVEPTPAHLLDIQLGRSTLVDPLLIPDLQRVFSADLLAYNRDWADVNRMLTGLFDPSFRFQTPDDLGGPWKFTWFCMDHVGYPDNPRRKALGWGVVRDVYADWLRRFPQYGDEIQWHHHPKAISSNPVAAATSYAGSMPEIMESLSRGIIDAHCFPAAFRPGFHAERPDAHLFLEQWIPFDFGNQSCEDTIEEPDMQRGRFGDWSRASRSWRGYRPALHDHQAEGDCRRWIFRCLNVGTRLRLLERGHVEESLTEAREHGLALLAFADHDFRDIARDVKRVLALIDDVRQAFPDVRIRFCSADEAGQMMAGSYPAELELSCSLEGNVLVVSELSGQVFGSQPFLAIRSRGGRYLHDNFDSPGGAGAWTYTFDAQTLTLDEVSAVGVGSAGRQGSSWTWVTEIEPRSAD